MKNYYFVGIVILMLLIACSCNKFEDNVVCDIDDDTCISSFEKQSPKESLIINGFEFKPAPVDMSERKEYRVVNSLSELDSILMNIDKIKSNSLKLEMSAVETRGNIVPVRGKNDDVSAAVFLDVQHVCVETSTATFHLMDVFLKYRHIAGDCGIFQQSNGDYVIGFTAYGQMDIKIIWNDLTIKTVDVMMEGWYNVTKNTGELTVF